RSPRARMRASCPLDARPMALAASVSSRPWNTPATMQPLLTAAGSATFVLNCTGFSVFVNLLRWLDRAASLRQATRKVKACDFPALHAARVRHHRSRRVLGAPGGHLQQRVDSLSWPGRPRRRPCGCRDGPAGALRVEHGIGPAVIDRVP